ncbi:MAG: putative signal transduction histidine kinase [Polaromonas sp.]|nr:putative signal transduction histidine kinase [Polaromonas sp.]
MQYTTMPILKSHEAPDDLVEKLRQANQNLVIASMRAQALQDRAEASVERQTEFLSMLAHELRNPLAPIAMASEILEKIGSSHPQLPKIQQIISRQVAHMKRLLDDLLDASRISLGKITLQKNPLLLTEVVKSAIEISQPLLTSQRQELTVRLPHQPLVINGDAVRLSQVFSNLLINAGKYSPEGARITLSAYQSASDMLAVSISDQGVGIEPEMQSIVFDLFAQVPRTLDRSEGGLGIGLAMVRTLVELHGGHVEVCSEGLGRGSEFIVFLPLANKSEEHTFSLLAQQDAARTCRILIIEDNVDANETLNLCLATDGHAVDSAFDGPTGLAMAKTGAYDIVVCDIGLPGMDGYQVVSQLKADKAAPQPFCMAMTGYDNPDYRARAREVGFDLYLVKPVSIEKLREIISHRYPARSPS